MNRNITLTVAFACFGLATSGCMSMPKAADMTPRHVAVAEKSAKPVRLVVKGEPTLEEKVVVQNAEMAVAARSALETSRLFSQVADGVEDGYQLEIAVMGYNPPRPGFNMTSTMTTHWTLTRVPSQEVLFEDFLKKSHTCKVGDAFAGATRWRKANEGVVRDTIADGIERLSKVKLQP
jgi:hypothetical protein